MSTNETNQLEALVDAKVTQAVQKLAVTLEQSLNRILTNERQKIAQQTATGHGLRLAEPTTEDLKEFANVKLQTTPLAEIVKMSGDEQGVTDDEYQQALLKEARRLGRAD
jgi:hypothetical protein